MKKKLLLLCVLCCYSLSYGQKKTVEQQAKEYVQWFSKLSTSEKHIASKNLVTKLNSLDAPSKGIWLAAFDAAEPKKNEPLKPKPYTQIEIESKLIDEVKSKIKENGYFKYYEIKNIAITKALSNKDIADYHNENIQQKIDSITILIKQLKEDREVLKRKIPEGYEPKNDSIYDYYFALEKNTYDITQYTHYLLDNKDSFYKGKTLNVNNAEVNWDDTTPKRYAIEVKLQEMNGIDDTKPKTSYFFGEYCPLGTESYNPNNQWVWTKLVEEKRDLDYMLFETYGMK